jgi:hypothetical protein
LVDAGEEVGRGEDCGGYRGDWVGVGQEELQRGSRPELSRTGGRGYAKGRAGQPVRQDCEKFGRLLRCGLLRERME